MINPLIEAQIKGLGEAIGLLHYVKNIIYDGEDEMAKWICVRLENEIADRMAELRSDGAKDES
jgi:hypothetical protein